MAENYSSKLDELKKKISSLEKLAKKQQQEQNKKHQAHTKKVKGDIDKHRKEIKKHKEEIDKYKKKITDLNKKLRNLEKKKARAQLKPTSTFKGQMGRLSKNVEDLLGLLEKAGKEVGDGKLQADKDIIEKLDTILNQNEKIAKGILAVADLIQQDRPADTTTPAATSDAFSGDSNSRPQPDIGQYPGVAPYQQTAETPANYVDKHDFSDLSSDLLGEEQQNQEAVTTNTSQVKNDGQDDLFADMAQAPGTNQDLGIPGQQPTPMQQPSMQQQPAQQAYGQESIQPPSMRQQPAQQAYGQESIQPPSMQQQPAQQTYGQESIQPQSMQQQPSQPLPMQQPSMQPQPTQPPPMQQQPFPQRPMNPTSSSNQFGIDQAPQPAPPKFEQDDIFNSPVQGQPDSNYMQAKEDQIDPLQPASMGDDAPPGAMPFDAPPPPPDSDLAPLGPPPAPNEFQPIQQNTAPTPPGRQQLRPFDNG